VVGRKDSVRERPEAVRETERKEQVEGREDLGSRIAGGVSFECPPNDLPGIPSGTYRHTSWARPGLRWHSEVYVRMSYRIGIFLFATLGLSGPLLAQEQKVATDDMPTVVVRPHKRETGQSLRDAATLFINDYFRHLSSLDALSYFERDYADSIIYYGQQVDRALVMREKSRFIRRWPQRLYIARATSLNVICDETNIAVCSITGLVDFECRSPDRRVVSTGLASFNAAILMKDNQPQIISEISRVLERS
jgi:hypothetical protein